MNNFTKSRGIIYISIDIRQTTFIGGSCFRISANRNTAHCTFTSSNATLSTICTQQASESSQPIARILVGHSHHVRKILMFQYSPLCQYPSQDGPSRDFIFRDFRFANRGPHDGNRDDNRTKTTNQGDILDVESRTRRDRE